MKILLIRLSSIGDIVLCSPVVRWIKTQLDKVELHFLTKSNFIETVQHNPYIDKIKLYEPNDDDFIPDLQNERYDYVVDLHNNWRSWKVRRAISGKIITYNKLNVRKWILCNFKYNLLPKIHLLDRYLYALQPLGIHNDGLGLDFFLQTTHFKHIQVPVKSILDSPAAENEQINLSSGDKIIANTYVAIAIGAAHATKQIPVASLLYVCERLDKKLILLGAKSDISKANELITQCRAETQSKIINLCGRLSLLESAYLVKMADWVITPDTGLMHIAAAFKKKLITIWGSTVLDFGMYPYYPAHLQHLYIVIENKLSCRPCSKLGYSICPKTHFNCMNKNNYQQLVDIINTENQIL
jgi:ADP-heptose:LPS heptosyltransferase